MNAPARLDSTPRLEDFPYRLTDNVRFADLDPNQHVNNAVYATYFETGRVTLVKDRSRGLMPTGLAWMLVRLDIHFRAELRWPGSIEMGLGVAKFGRTSVTFDQVVFSEGKCVATAQSVTVLIDEKTRKPTPLTEDNHRKIPALAAAGRHGAMMRAALLGILIACAATQPTAAEQYYREELRIPMPAVGRGGLEALLVRPPGPQAYPLALISHGTSRDAQVRQDMTPYWFYRQAIEFARRGFASLVVMRRGFGSSGGVYADGTGCCTLASYLRSAKASADDLRAAIAAMKGRTDVTTQGMIAVGVSTGGFATVSLTSDPPPGLAGAINFAGGLHRASLTGTGKRNDRDEAALVDTFATLGKRSRTPMLWIYAENDTFFRPDLAHRLHAAFIGGGGRAQLIDAPAFGSEGHDLFSKGTPIWTRMVDDFLHQQNLGARDLLAAPRRRRCRLRLD